MEPQEVKQAVDDLLKAVDQKTTEIQKAGADMDARVQKISEQLAEHGAANSEAKDAYQKQSVTLNELLDEHKALTLKLNELESQPGPGAQKSVGALATEADVLKGRSPEQSWIGKAILVDQAKMSLTKAVTSQEASAGPLLQVDQQSGIIRDPFQPLSIRDLVTVSPTSFSTVEWYRHKSTTNNAGPVPEMALKPESNVTFENARTSMVTLAHWLPAAKQILADVPGLRAFIDQELIMGLKLKEEAQVLLGDGVAPNLHGILPQATAYAAASVGGSADDTNVDTLRRVLLQVQLTGYPTDAFVLNPVDWTNIELAKTADNAYLFTDPKTGTSNTLWGRRVAISQAVPQGQFIGGSMRLGVTLYDRETISVDVADQHAELFVHNALAIRVEERVGVAVKRPKAIVTGNFA